MVGNQRIILLIRYKEVMTSIAEKIRWNQTGNGPLLICGEGGT